MALRHQEAVKVTRRQLPEVGDGAEDPSAVKVTVVVTNYHRGGRPPSAAAAAAVARTRRGLGVGVLRDRLGACRGGTGAGLAFAFACRLWGPGTTGLPFVLNQPTAYGDERRQANKGVFEWPQEKRANCRAR